MNELAKLVAEGILDEFKTVMLCGRMYIINAPTSYVIGRMLKPLSHVDVAENETRMSASAKSTEQSKYIDEAIALAILGDVPMNPSNRLRLRRMKRLFCHADDADRLQAFSELISIINPEPFFLCARLAMNLTQSLAGRKSSEDAR